MQVIQLLCCNLQSAKSSVKRHSLTNFLSTYGFYDPHQRHIIHHVVSFLISNLINLSDEMFRIIAQYFLRKCGFSIRPSMLMSGYKASVYDVKLIRAVFNVPRTFERGACTACAVLFTLIAPIKVTNSHPETFSIGPLPWPIPKYTYFICETFSVPRRERDPSSSARI